MTSGTGLTLGAPLLATRLDDSATHSRNHRMATTTLAGQRRFLVTLGAALLAGCASAPTNVPSTDPQYSGYDARSGRWTRSVSPASGRPSDSLLAAPDKVWAALPAVYESLGMKPTSRDDQTMVTGVQNLVVRRRLGGEALSRALDCGLDVLGANADNFEVHLTVMSLVRPTSPSGSALDTRVSAWAAPNGLSTTVQCGSTGRLEDRIAKSVQAIVATAGSH